MRWLYLCSDLGIPLDGTKGASEHVRAITRALARSGQDVSVLAPRGHLPPEHPCRQVHTPLGVECRDLADRLREWFKRAGANAAMGGEISQLVFDARLGSWLAESPAFAEPQVRPDVILERLSLFSTAGCDLARHLDVPYLVEMNAPIAWEAARYRDAGLQALALRVEQQTLRSADIVMTVSSALRDYVISERGVAPENVITIPNGVDMAMFSPARDRRRARLDAGVPADALVYGFVGSLKAWHGVDVLLHAFARIRESVPAAHLLIVGDTRRAEEYRCRASEMGIGSRVTFAGERGHHEVPALLAAMDVGVAPYLPQGNFYFSPLKLFEYMAAGLCVVASDAGQISEIIQHGQSGLLFAPGDIGELSLAMIEAGCDAALREQLGESARRSVAGRDWADVAAQIVMLAKQAIVGRRHTREAAIVG